MKRFSRYLVLRTVLATVGVFLTPPLVLALGTPIVPGSDDQVIEQLPDSLVDSQTRALQAALTRNPSDEAAAVQLVHRYLSLSGQSGDERYLGYAERVLEPWQQQPLPAQIALAKARLLQRQHQFEPALVLIDQVIERAPRNGEAHLLAAYIHMAQGRAREALPHCAAASLSVGPVNGAACTARVKSLIGEAEDAYRTLTDLMTARQMQPWERQEVLLTLAEIDVRLGRADAAEKYLGEILAAESRHVLALEMLADLQLQQQRYRDCIALLEDAGEHPALQLRLTIAARAVGEGDAKALTEKLARYYETAGYRTPDYASRDYGRYLLQVAASPQRALDVAVKNWQSQREPDDALLVVAAARQAGALDSIPEVLQWLDRNRLQDVRIQRLREGMAQ